jgi:hypothetical protein
MQEANEPWNRSAIVSCSGHESIDDLVPHAPVVAVEATKKLVRRVHCLSNLAGVMPRESFLLEPRIVFVVHWDALYGADVDRVRLILWRQSGAHIEIMPDPAAIAGRQPRAAREESFGPRAVPRDRFSERREERRISATRLHPYSFEVRKLGWPSRVMFGASAAVSLVSIFTSDGAAWAIVAVVAAVAVSALVIRHDRRQGQ